jgi:hypothetical protein
MNGADDLVLDGNAVAGGMRDVFSVDVTTATGQCAGCGYVTSFAQTRVYTQAPGIVVRCAMCEGVLMRLVKTPERAWLDARGLVYLQFSTAQPGEG